MGLENLRTLDMDSAAPPPPKTTCPVSPSKSMSRLLDSAPTAHTIASARPSAVVTIGEPRPFSRAHHAVEIWGGLVALIRIATRSPAFAQPTPAPRMTTYVPWPVV